MPTTNFILQAWDQHDTQSTIMTCTISMDPSLIRGMHSMFGSSLVLPSGTISWYPQRLPERGAVLLSLEGWISAASDPATVKGVHIPAQTAIPYSGLTLPLSAEHIEAIEEHRRGEAVMLRMQLAGLAVLPNPDMQVRNGMQSPYQQQGTEALLQRPDVYRIGMQGDTGLRIEREQWLGILEQLGAGKRRLVELPSAALPNQMTSWDGCCRQLNEATLYYRRGEYEQSVAWCRKVVEGIATVIAEAWNVQRPQFNGFEKWTRSIQHRLENAWQSDTTSPSMLSALLTSAWAFTSPSHHYGSDIPLREETAIVLSFATDLLVFGGQLLRAHPHPVAAQAADIDSPDKA